MTFVEVTRRYTSDAKWKSTCDIVELFGKFSFSGMLGAMDIFKIVGMVVRLWFGVVLSAIASNDCFDAFG